MYCLILKMDLLILVFSILSLYIDLLSGCDSFSETSPARSDVDQLLDEYFDWRVRVIPEFGTKYGIYRYEDKLTQHTPQAYADVLESAKDFQGRTSKLKLKMMCLDKQRQISLKILETDLTLYIKGSQFKRHSAYNAFNYLTNPLNEWKFLIERMKTATKKDYENIIARYRLLPNQFSQFITLMREAVSAGITQHAVALITFKERLDKVLNASSEDTFFIKPFNNITSSSISESERVILKFTAVDVFINNIKPALQDMKRFLDVEYAPYTRPEPGVWSLPIGDEFYQACLDFHLTVSKSPDEVHQLGLDEVARILSEIKKIQEEDGIHGSVQHYRAWLQQQPTSYFTTEDEMLQYIRDTMADARGRLLNVMDHVPDVEFELKKADSPNGALAYYRPASLDGSTKGTFYVNAFYPDKKPNYIFEALTLHEAEPGHHFQISYALENNLPLFRRARGGLPIWTDPYSWPSYSAFVEGWGLYAEFLGTEMGMYRTRHSKLGQLSSEIFRAARLVVDTGIHWKRWSEEEAVNYLINNTLFGEVDIRNEVKRYISWPGQACSYKVGELEIKRWRKKAERVLGEKFDIKEFHRVILETGSSSLGIIEERVDEWVSVTSGTSPFPQQTIVFIIFVFMIARLV